MWIKTELRSYEITEINVVIKNNEDSEIWAKRTDGSTIRLYKGSIEDIKDHKEAIEFAIKNDLKIYEM